MRWLKRNNKTLKTAFLVLVLAAVALAQSASEWDSHAVNAIAAKLKCSCGCKQDIACTMPPYPCPVCKMNKIRIFNMMNSGMTEQQILDTYVKEQGPDVLVVHPGLAGNIGPWAAVAGGLMLVILLIRRLRMRTAAAPASAPVDPAVLEQIEKDLDKLDE
jgi:cytochrome c-type biogenesis protein CcmH/NrfF